MRVRKRLRLVVKGAAAVAPDYQFASNDSFTRLTEQVFERPWSCCDFGRVRHPAPPQGGAALLGHTGTQHRAHTTKRLLSFVNAAASDTTYSGGLLAGFLPTHDNLLDIVLELPGLLSDFEHRRNGSRITSHGTDDNAA